MRACLLILVACLTAACGQTGPLYLPDEGITTPVEIRTQQTAPPAEAPASEDEDEEPAPPPG
jgi:predicted small lipoprotein YifL